MAINMILIFSRLTKPRNTYYHFVNARKSHILVGARRSCESVPNQETKFCKIPLPNQIRCREIRVTDLNRALHPVLILILRPVAKFLAIISGRMLRKWWAKLSPEEKQMILDRIKNRKGHIAAFGSFTFITLLLYYYSHVVETPITKRKRFIMLNKDTMNQVADMAYDLQLLEYKRDIVPRSHPFFRRTARVATAILLGNIDIPEIKNTVWDLVVVDRPDVANAFCLPNGKIFVFTGILNVCTNDDQLAIVMSHEIAHTLLSHAAESMSKLFLVDAFIFIPTLIIWMFFTDLWAVLSQWATNVMMNILIHLPFSRAIEKEADSVGLHLAARSCFDVREAPVLWSKMSILDNSSPIEWLSTHPSGETRQHNLKLLLPEALKTRSMSNCPRMGPPGLRSIFTVK